MRVLFAIVMALLSLTAPGQAGKNEDQTKNHKTQANQSAQGAPTKTPTVQETPSPTSQPTPKGEKPTPDPESKSWLTHGEWVISILTGIYVLLTAVYVVISFRTLRAIRREEKSNADRFNKQLLAMKEAGEQTDKLITEAAKQAAALAVTANAAKQSADAMIHIERAWMLADPSPTIDESGIDVKIWVHIKNKGKSVAWMTEGGGGHGGSNLSDIPDYGRNIKQWPNTGMPLAPESWQPHVSKIPRDHWSKVENGTLIIYVFGFVKYTDIFKEHHITRYCFRFDPAIPPLDPSLRGFYVDGPAAYNEAT